MGEDNFNCTKTGLPCDNAEDDGECKISLSIRCRHNPEAPNPVGFSGPNEFALLNGLRVAQRDIDDIIQAGEYLARCADCGRAGHTTFICPHCGSRQ